MTATFPPFATLVWLLLSNKPYRSRREAKGPPNQDEMRPPGEKPPLWDTPRQWHGRVMRTTMKKKVTHGLRRFIIVTHHRNDVPLPAPVKRGECNTPSCPATSTPTKCPSRPPQGGVETNFKGHSRRVRKPFASDKHPLKRSVAMGCGALVFSTSILAQKYKL